MRKSELTRHNCYYDLTQGQAANNRTSMLDGIKYA